MTPAQCRSARGLLGWTQAELAEKARVGLSTVRGFENGAKTPVLHNFEAIKKAFEDSSIRFFGETGVISMNEVDLLLGNIDGKALAP